MTESNLLENAWDVKDCMARGTQFMEPNITKNHATNQQVGEAWKSYMKTVFCQELLPQCFGKVCLCELVSNHGGPIDNQIDRIGE